MDSIFIESSETLGILYNRYSKIPKKIDEFMDSIDKCITISKKEGISKKNVDLKSKLEEFKKQVEIDIKDPEEVDISNMKTLRNEISALKKYSIKLLKRLGSLRHAARYGDNLLNGILIKPKIFTNTTDAENLENVNALVRSINRSLDWAEKIIIDLMNLADQDLNILTLVNEVYYKKIYENDEDNGIIDILEESIEYNYEPFYSGESSSNTENEIDEDDILTMRIGVGEDEYYPVFCIVVSYDDSKIDQVPDEVKDCINRGKTIRKLTKGDQYTHSLITFDTSFEHLFHFMGSGFGSDSIYENKTFEITKSIYVTVTFLTKEERDSVLNEVKRYNKEKDSTFYSLMGMINQLFGRSKHVDKRQICSTFIGYILSRANIKNLHRDYSLIRPEDITILPRSFYVITFKDVNDFIANKTKLDERVNKIYQDNIEEIREYNNILPKVVIKEQYKKKGTLDGILDWFVIKLAGGNR